MYCSLSDIWVFNDGITTSEHNYSILQYMKLYEKAPIYTSNDIS